MTRNAYFDCLSGISGDMTLGALIDLGADASAIQSAVQSMGLPDLRISAQPVKKCGFRALSVKIEHPPEHAHRHLHHITDMIEKGEISPKAKELANKIFLEVAVAEAKVHGTTLEKVHFHEVGAIDSIADIVGCAVAITELEIDAFSSSYVPTGTGSIRIAHGNVSIPAPATAEILRGVPIAACDISAELTTPTGAAILKATCDQFGPMPGMTIQAVGYGAGTMDLEGQANVLRIVLGQPNDQTRGLGRVLSDRAVVLETNVDDCTAEQLAECCERLLEAGALDVFQTPCTMKKGRAGILLSVITGPSRVGMLESIIFQHTSTIGIRRHTVDRHKLVRKPQTVETEFGPVVGKAITLPDGSTRFTVEADSAKEVATRSGTTSADVKAAANRAFNAN